ncbi:rod shape-determining protein MreD [Desertibacillus haloalkaliphilus]|uniref:rod shape-determining protein MreD n=1 Tax=Desertibacillus haloalkaliphilus TaxID=1328930 RepID=UPI001C2560EE|nr:rod shape-determining protein MreD [Desertibacillus haloalkaliphilus]MBU8905038.1 rod shape-determining protein MreD [Desertibacillus haloalkaliphilus]
MIRYLLPMIVFCLFIFEGTIFQVFSPSAYGSDLLLVPRFVVVMIVFIAIFNGRGYGLVYGMIFGIFYDVIYTNLLGIYTFALGLVGYSFALGFARVKRSYALIVILTLLAVVFVEYFVYGLYTLIGHIEVVHEVFLSTRLLPGVILNGVFAALIAYPLKKFLLYIKRLDYQREN